jgi:hypothetical protein
VVQDDPHAPAPEPDVEPTPAPASFSPPSLWDRVRRLFAPDQTVRAERLRQLNWAVSVYPDVPTNYVLRGELLLGAGDTVGAIADFRRALELAAEQAVTEDWGVVAQSVQDRALADLRDALRQHARYNRSTNHMAVDE